jgi:hypothetical protein
MARMRSVKPEYWADEELSDLPRDARLMYVGLWNLADEHGRLRGDPRYVKGQLFPYDDDLSPATVDLLLNALSVAGKVVRYRVAGKQYLHLPKLAKHQRLEPEKVPSRLPGPDEADPEPNPDPPASRANKIAPRTDESAPREEDHALKHVAGSREQVTPTAGALALRADPPSTTDGLIAEWLTHCPKRPPNQVIAQVGKHVKAMLSEGLDLGDVRAGLAGWHQKGLHPSALPSVVNELMNAPVRASPKPSTTDQRVMQAKGAVEQAKAMLAGGAA